MTVYPVSLRVNNPANGAPDSIGVPDHEPREAGGLPERDE